MPFVNISDMLECLTDPELDAALQGILRLIEDRDLWQSLAVAGPDARARLRKTLDDVDRVSADVEDSVIRHERDKATGRKQ